MKRLSSEDLRVLVRKTVEQALNALLNEEAALKMPKLKGLTFQTAIIERYRRGKRPEAVVKELRCMRLNEAAKTVENGIEETQ